MKAGLGQSSKELAGCGSGHRDQQDQRISKTNRPPHDAVAGTRGQEVSQPANQDVLLMALPAQTLHLQPFFAANGRRRDLGKNAPQRFHSRTQVMTAPKSNLHIMHPLL